MKKAIVAFFCLCGFGMGITGGIMRNLLILMLIVVARVAFADGLIPEIKLRDEATLQLSGWMQIVTAQSVYQQEGGTEWSNFRFTADLNWDNWELFTQLNLPVNEGEIDSNWLRQLWIKHTFADNWSVTAGRLFISAANATPSPYGLRTVNYPNSITFPCHAWGVQVAGELLKGLTLSVDVTGMSGIDFDSEESFDRAELSLMLKQSFGDPKKPGYGYLAGYGQFYQGLQRYGAEVYWEPTSRLTILGALCYSKYEDCQTSDEVGAYGLMAYKVFPWLEPHIQLDWFEHLKKTWHEAEYSKDESGNVSMDYVEYCSDSTRQTTLTLGTKLMETHDAFSFTVDYEIPVDSNELNFHDGRLFAKFQVKF